MKIKNNESGLAHIAIVALVVLVIGIVGFAGWKVWDKKDIKISNESPATATKSTARDADETKTTSKDKRYLEIKEYGLKIALTEGIEDAYITIDPYPPASAGGSYLSVHSLDEYPRCKIVAAVSKAKVGDPIVSSDDLFTKEYLERVSSFKMGEYYYWITLSKGTSCVDESKENNTDTRETRARKAFSEAKFEKL